MFDRKTLLLAATLLSSAITAFPARAEVPFVAPDTVPPTPSALDVSIAALNLANPINKPVTGALQRPAVIGGEVPPSLEALQAARPGDTAASVLKPGRAEQLKESAHVFGAQGGLAGRAFAINDMLRRYEPTLDTTFDFSTLVLPVGSGQTLMRPPVITQAQLAFALGENGQVARETACIYQITREASLTALPPNWRSYLVRTWQKPNHPSDAGLPGTKAEVAYWDKWVAEGWADGEKQAVDIFLSDLNRLQADIEGMARYRVLLSAGLVEQPRVAFQNTAAIGVRDNLHLGDRVVRITGQPGLQAKRKHGYGYGGDCQ